VVVLAAEKNPDTGDLGLPATVAGVSASIRLDAVSLFSAGETESSVVIGFRCFKDLFSCDLHCVLQC